MSGDSRTYYPEDLSDLSLDCACEVDWFLQGKSEGFGKSKELATTSALFEVYWPLHLAMKKGSEKKLKGYEELALKMRLFRYELEDVIEGRRNPDVSRDAEALFDISKFLCSLSHEFTNLYCQMHVEYCFAA